MKKLTLFGLLLVFISCSLDSGTKYAQGLLPIDEAETPEKFILNTIDTVKVKYTLPNACFSFYGLYYERKENERIIAIRALENLDEACASQVIERELDIPIEIVQQEDYVFKFWKGKDSDGNDIFDEVTVPVE